MLLVSIITETNAIMPSGSASPWIIDWLIPIMSYIFIFAVIFRLLISYCIKSEERFSKGFANRVQQHLKHEHLELIGEKDFHKLLEKCLDMTFTDLFVERKKKMRFNYDYTMSLIDRLFLIEVGTQRLIQDTLQQTKYNNIITDETPNFNQIAKHTFSNNPHFNKLIGLVSINDANRLLSILPGLFIIGGILGTFLGIAIGLPQLNNLDLNNLEGAQTILGSFMINMAFAINTSLFGISFSIGMTVLNAIFNFSNKYISLVDKYEISMNFLWKYSKKANTYTDDEIENLKKEWSERQIVLDEEEQEEGQEEEQEQEKEKAEPEAVVEEAETTQKAEPEAVVEETETTQEAEPEAAVVKEKEVIISDETDVKDDVKKVMLIDEEGKIKDVEPVVIDAPIEKDKDVA